MPAHSNGLHENQIHLSKKGAMVYLRVKQNGELVNVFSTSVSYLRAVLNKENGYMYIDPKEVNDARILESKEKNRQFKVFAKESLANTNNKTQQMQNLDLDEAIANLIGKNG